MATVMGTMKAEKRMRRGTNSLVVRLVLLRIVLQACHKMEKADR
jgi:hypothetical protein